MASQHPSQAHCSFKQQEEFIGGFTIRNERPRHQEGDVGGAGRLISDFRTCLGGSETTHVCLGSRKVPLQEPCAGAWRGCDKEIPAWSPLPLNQVSLSGLGPGQASASPASAWAQVQAEEGPRTSASGNHLQLLPAQPALGLKYKQKKDPGPPR